MANRHGSVVLFVVLLAASTRFLLASYHRGDLFTVDSLLFYQAGTLGFNYFEMGAVRRGLGGSIVYLLSSDTLHGTVAFHLLSAAAVALPVTWLVSRLQMSLFKRTVFAFVAMSIVLRWAEDAGRTDMAIAALLAGATIAMVRGRLVLAVAALCVGLFMHESSFIFGVPLLAGLALRQGGASAFSGRDKAGAAFVLGLGLTGYLLLPYLPHADTQAMVDTVRSKFPPHRYVDWAIYFAVSGPRGVEASICQNLTDPGYWIHPFGGAVVLLAVWLALGASRRQESVPVLVAAVPPFAFLCIVANDTARWTMLASFNIWLVLSTLPQPLPASPTAKWRAAASALAFLLLSYPKPTKVEHPIYAGSPLIETVFRKLGGPMTPDVDVALRRCDPNWLGVLGDPVPSH
jgi:hypothetical protein